MAQRKTIKKAVLIGTFLLAGGGITSLLIAANRKEADHYCQGVEVRIRHDEPFFVTKQNIAAQINAFVPGGVVQKSIKTIDVSGLERKIEAHPWIQDAELYFDTHDVLHVAVSERQPVARVYYADGTSFYIDSNAFQMPLLKGAPVRVPIITGFPQAKKLTRDDSAFVKETASLATFLKGHAFWKAQIAQIDITPAKTYELLPVVGNHIIRIGKAEDIAQKLDNLLLFYKQVSRKAGIDKYAVIDVQFKDQVIGCYQKEISKIDSVQLQRNIAELIRKTKQQAEADSLQAVETQQMALRDSLTRAADEAAAATQSNPAKPVTRPAANPSGKTSSKTVVKPDKRKTPKAVMQQKEQGN